MLFNEKVKKTIEKIYRKVEVINNPTCYLYFLDDIREKVNKIEKEAPKNLKLYYAMKANPNENIIKFLKSNEYVRGIEIASEGELRKALKYYEPKDIIYTGPGKTQYELETVINKGIRLINVESLVEALRIQKTAHKNNCSKVDILLRINTDYYVDDVEENMAGCSSKMGIDECQIYDVINMIKGLDKINIKGIHVFSASGVMEYEKLTKYNQYVFDLVNKLQKQCDINIEIIDFGGGIGIDYSGANLQFDIVKYFDTLNNQIKDYNFENKEMILESGKYLVGECGFYTAEIIDIKDTKNYKHIVAAGGLNHMRKPAATGVKNPLYIINRNASPLYPNQPIVSAETVDIGGPLCFSEDKLSWDDYIEFAEIGDIVVLSQSGAYCYSASVLEMLSHMYPEEFIIEGEYNEI